ncbi:hypothetical protein RB2083_2117 [Rhodobacteraceae bacterium HTCC2083]|nr:hypothetical protein RB2083_2117 [Rhodobacteraceae bacterium HTCC2083]
MSDVLVNATLAIRKADGLILLYCIWPTGAPYKPEVFSK